MTLVADSAAAAPATATHPRTPSRHGLPVDPR